MWTFLSTLSLRRATSRARCSPRTRRHFYPRSPCGERQGEKRANQSEHCISIHALLAESDGTLSIRIIGFSGFLSTLSLRRATNARPDIRQSCAISIHALLAESDCYSLRHSAQGWHFYPRSPCGERPQKQEQPAGQCQFLSTLSLRRATKKGSGKSTTLTNFYPRSPCGERP